MKQYLENSPQLFIFWPIFFFYSIHTFLDLYSILMILTLQDRHSTMLQTDVDRTQFTAWDSFHIENQYQSHKSRLEILSIEVIRQLTWHFWRLALQPKDVVLLYTVTRSPGFANHGFTMIVLPKYMALLGTWKIKLQNIPKTMCMYNSKTPILFNISLGLTTGWSSHSLVPPLTMNKRTLTWSC